MFCVPFYANNCAKSQGNIFQDLSGAMRTARTLPAHRRRDMEKFIAACDVCVCVCGAHSMGR